VKPCSGKQRQWQQDGEAGEHVRGVVVGHGLPTSPETLRIDLADCKVLETHVRAEAGTFFKTSSARMAFDNCMRSKGYIKS
jgi:hypothetical protein